MESSPYDLRFYDNAHSMYMREQNYIAFLQGQYILEAVATCFDKNHQYPKEPYEFDDYIAELNPERNERKAILEMEQYIAMLEKEGVKPRTI